MGKVYFCAADAKLRVELEGIRVRLQDLGLAASISQCAPESCKPDEAVVVCVSVLPNDPGMGVIKQCAGQGEKCGVIMRTESRTQWRRLSDIHRESPLLFVIATGGPQEYFKEMFPGINVGYFSDFDPPYDRGVSSYISTFVQRVAAC